MLRKFNMFLLEKSFLKIVCVHACVCVCLCVNWSVEVLSVVIAFSLWHCVGSPSSNQLRAHGRVCVCVCVCVQLN